MNERSDLTTKTMKLYYDNIKVWIGIIFEMVGTQHHATAKLLRLTESGFFSVNALTFKIEKPITFPFISTFSITASFSVSLKYPAFFSSLDA